MHRHAQIKHRQKKSPHIRQKTDGSRRSRNIARFPGNKENLKNTLLFHTAQKPGWEIIKEDREKKLRAGGMPAQKSLRAQRSRKQQTRRNPRYYIASDRRKTKHALRNMATRYTADLPRICVYDGFYADDNRS